MANILLLNGPNLNLLGSRETKTYGHQTLESIVNACKKSASELGHELNHFQSNAEHELIDTLQQCKADFIVFNPAALTHTSIALRDALLARNIPFIECHITNIYAREAFRHESTLRDIAVGTICGFGACSYHLALQAAHHYLTQGLDTLWT